MLIRTSSVGCIREVLADTEVTELRKAEIRLNKQIVGLDVPVDLVPLLMKVHEAVEDLEGEPRDHQLWYQGPDLHLVGCVKVSLDRNHGLDAAAVHVLHH